MTLRSVDLRLLIVLDAVLKERSVTRAAQRLCISQPAVSSALAKLRHLLNDELFIRVAGGIRPTPRAQDLAAPIHGLLAQLHVAFEPVTFAASTSSQSFTLAVSEHCAALLMPDLIDRLHREAPSMRVHSRPKAEHRTAAELDAGEIDYAIGVFTDVPPRFRQVTLFEDEHVCVMRPDHPLSGRMSLPGFVAAAHLGVAPFPGSDGGASSSIDRTLRQLGHERRVHACVSQLLLTPYVLQRTDLLLTTFRHLVQKLPPFATLHVEELPMTVGPVGLRLLWHPVNDNHPGHQWLRAQIIDICRRFAPGANCYAPSS